MPGGFGGLTKAGGAGLSEEIAEADMGAGGFSEMKGGGFGGSEEGENFLAGGEGLLEVRETEGGGTGGEQGFAEAAANEGVSLDGGNLAGMSEEGGGGDLSSFFEGFESAVAIAEVL